MTELGWQGPPLARTALDRAAHHRLDDAWQAEAFKSGLVLIIDKGKALVRLDPPSLVLVGPDDAPDGERLYLGLDPTGIPIFAVVAELPPAAPGVEARSLRDFGHLLDPRDAGILTTATALANWHASHLYSPKSGQTTQVIEAGWSRVDPDGSQMWPRTDPAMIVVVHDGVAGPDGRCLLGHNANWPDAGGVRRFSCLAGFVEPGESAEAAVLREVQEEVGVKVTSLRYEGSQSWPYPGSLMLGFTAVADPAQQLRLDPAEIDEARWFTRAELAQIMAGATPGVGLPMPSSIAYYLIDTWLNS